MEFRQILTVAIFMLAAAVMKSTFSDQLEPTQNSTAITQSTELSSLSGEMFTAIPVELVAQNSFVTLIPVRSAEPVQIESSVVINHIPGSLVAIVVAVLGLVSVARRTSNT